MTLKSWAGAANTTTDKNAEARDYAVMLLAENGYRAGKYNPHNTGAWEIGNEFGALCIVIGDHEQDALDVAVDSGYMEGEKMSDKDEQEWVEENKTDDNEYPDDPPDTFRAGNASELFDSPYLWIKEMSIQ